MPDKSKDGDTTHVKRIHQGEFGREDSQGTRNKSETKSGVDKDKYASGYGSNRAKLRD